MAATAVLAVEQGWGGDRKRHRVALALATGLDLLPSQVGLHQIDAIEHTGAKTGTMQLAGVTVTLTDIGTVTGFAYTTQTCTLTVQTAGNSVWYVYGW